MAVMTVVDKMITKDSIEWYIIVVITINFISTFSSFHLYERIPETPICSDEKEES